MNVRVVLFSLVHTLVLRSRQCNNNHKFPYMDSGFVTFFFFFFGGGGGEYESIFQ